MQTLKTNPGFEVEGNVTEIPSKPVHNPVATEMLRLALVALSQRAVIAIASMFSITLAGSVFALFWSVLPNPSTYALIGCGMYAVFVLALHIARLKK